MRSQNLNQIFIKKIFRDKKNAIMRSETKAFSIGPNSYNVLKDYLRSFDLFEEFSGRSIHKTIRERRETFRNSDSEIRRRVEMKVEREVESFNDWLREVKGLHFDIAHYYSVSLRSLLLGLPVGVEVALCFGIILNDQSRKSSDLPL